MSLRPFSLVWGSWVRVEVWIGGISISGVCPIRWSVDVGLEVVVLVKTTSCFFKYDECFCPIPSRPRISLNTLTINEYVGEHQQKDSEIVVQTNSTINRMAEALNPVRA